MKIRTIMAGVLVIAVGAILALAWNSGRESALRDEAIGAACRAASEAPYEAADCVSDMKAAYVGPLDDYNRLANAAAQHVAKRRTGQ